MENLSLVSCCKEVDYLKTTFWSVGNWHVWMSVYVWAGEGAEDDIHVDVF